MTTHSDLARELLAEAMKHEWMDLYRDRESGAEPPEESWLKRASNSPASLRAIEAALSRPSPAGPEVREALDYFQWRFLSWGLTPHASWPKELRLAHILVAALSLPAEGAETVQALRRDDEELSDELLISRAKETAEIAMRERSLGKLTAPYAGILLLAMAERIRSGERETDNELDELCLPRPKPRRVGKVYSDERMASIERETATTVEQAYRAWQSGPIDYVSDDEEHKLIEAAFRGGWSAGQASCKKLISRLIKDADEEKERADEAAFTEREILERAAKACEERGRAYRIAEAPGWHEVDHETAQCASIIRSLSPQQEG